MSHLSDPRPLQGKTILVIEEDFGNKTALTFQLHNAGAEVLAAADLDHAREHLAEGAARPDMILLGDVSRGKLEEEKNFCRELKYPAHGHTQRIPLVVVSSLGITPDKNADDLKDAGADLIFRKPYSPRELLECLSRLTSATPAPQLTADREHLGAASSAEREAQPTR